MSKIQDLFRWRKTTPTEVPVYGAFGSSSEVVGLEPVTSRRYIYTYSRGSWYTEGLDHEVPAPTEWHYLPRRPMKQQEQKETYVTDNTTTKL